jgi:hypothetical protein
MERHHRTLRRWRRRSLISLAVLLPFVLPAAFASALLGHGLWEAGFNRCGEEMARYSGWATRFNGDGDSFVCVVVDAKGQTVARKEVPVKDVLGKLGHIPLVPELSAHAMELADSDHLDNR